MSLGLSTKPSYSSKGRSKVRLTTEVRNIISACLAENKQKRGQGLHKQLMKGVDIHEYIVSQGYSISYSTVIHYLQRLKKSGKEAFIKQIYTAGSSCEFDWGTVKLLINGKLQVLQMAVFTCCYSNYRWAKLFYRQDTLAFMQSHVDFFSHTGGTHRELIYDNMRVAVARFVGKNEKEPTRALLELSNYYTFGFRFCNTGKGNEKGHVERSVEYIRRKAFCKAIDFRSIAAANAALLKKCIGLNGKGQRLKNHQTAQELFIQEKLHLYPAPEPYHCFTEQHAKVDKYATISVCGNRYSVPDTLVGKLLTVRVFAESIQGYHHKEQVCSHRRSYGANVWTISITHYLRTLAIKPGALKNSVAFEALDTRVKRIYHTYFQTNSKDFIELLQYCKTHQLCFNQIETAVVALEKINITNMSKYQILTVIDKQAEAVPEQTKASKARKEIECYAQASLEQLSALMN